MFPTDSTNIVNVCDISVWRNNPFFGIFVVCSLRPGIKSRIIINLTVMKRTFTLIAALILAMPAIRAQEVYSLPKTSLSLEVETVIETFHAGPYAEYAKKYLGVDARLEDSSSSHIRKVVMTPHVEADMSARYSAALPASAFGSLTSQGLVCVSGEVASSATTWRFPSAVLDDFSERGVTSNNAVESTKLYKTDEDGFVSEITQSMLVEKTPERRAAEAAEMVFKLRNTRIQIITGDTDMTYSGEAMGAAVAEMKRLEKEYLSLFIGYTDVQTQIYNVEVVPDKTKSSHKYVAFRLSDTEGAVAADNLSGSPVVLELVPEAVAQAPASEAKSGKGALVHYRVPAVCQAKLYEGTNMLLNARIPVYQLGVESTTFVMTK